MAYPYIHRWQLQVTRYIADYGDDCAVTYAAACAANNADVVAANPAGYIVVGQTYVDGPWGKGFRIVRGLCSYNLSGSPGDAVKAVLTSMGAFVKGRAIIAYIYDGTGLTGAAADFGAIGDLTTVLGSAYIPDLDGVDEYYSFKIEFNALGLAFLESKAGGTAILAFKVAADGVSEPGTCPAIMGYEEFFLPSEPYLHKIHINSESGYIWVEGIYLAYLDGNYLKRLQQGTTTGTSGAIPGHYWVEPNDTYLRYIDNTGAERIIEGNLFASQGKISGQIGIRSDLPSYLRYIDGYGDERSFIGDLAT